MMRHALLVLLLCLFATPAFALKVSPFKAALPPDGSGGGQVFRVDNNSAEPAAVQVSVLTWDIAPDGSETNADAEPEFSIFPAQMVLKPFESRAVRVQWLGRGPLASEKAYRLMVEQLPVHLQGTPDAGSAVRFMLRFKAALYISPPAAKSDVAVSAVAPAPDGRLRVTLANKGTAHALLRNPVLKLTLQDGKTAAITGDPLKPLEGENIHAGRTRYFDLALPGHPAQTVAAAHLDFEPAF